MFYECCKWVQIGEYLDIESNKYCCQEPKASQYTLEENTLKSEWLGVTRE